VARHIETSLDAINEISRQLLSLFDINIENIKSEENKDYVKSTSVTPTEDSQLSDDTLANLVTKRHKLINQLFEDHTKESLSRHSELINEMISLDEKLKLQAQSNKQILTDKILKLKKSKKVSKLYNKY
jgi:hypothetical protein